MDYAQVVKTILKEHEAFGREDATGRTQPILSMMRLRPRRQWRRGNCR